jgi:aspartate racemase
MNEKVYWPKDEKIIGVLGVAPIATADFYTKLVSRSMQRDWQYPRVLMDINSKIPSRGRYFELGETDPVPYIRDGIAKLREHGADFVVIPCNTAHILYDRFAKEMLVPVPNIVDVTVGSVAQNGLSHSMILCSRAARENKLYEHAFTKFGISSVQFPDQELISKGIEAVKQNQDIGKIAESICEILGTYSDIDSVIYGCTEIDILMRSMTNGINCAVIDSNKALADFCVKFVNEATIDKRIRLLA